jgi:hypothetical protein
MMTLEQVADNLSRRLTRIFLRNDRDERPFYGGQQLFQHDLTGAITSCFTNTFMAMMAQDLQATRRATGLVAN